jgi:hypothetical protein
MTICLKKVKDREEDGLKKGKATMANLKKE